MAEHDEQAAFWNFVQAKQLDQKYPVYAVPNQRRPETVGRMKKEGMVAGALDFNVDVARQGYHGLRIEFKWGPNTLSPEQQEMARKLMEQRYLASVCYDADEGIAELTWYLELNEFQQFKNARQRRQRRDERRGK